MISMIPEIKICGITDPEDAYFASSLGASIIGVVLSEQSPRKGTPDLVRELAGKGFHVAAVYTDLNSVRVHSTDEEYVQIHFPHGKEAISYVKEVLEKRTISVVFPTGNTHFMEDAEARLKMGADLVLLDFGKDISSSDIGVLPDLKNKRIGLAGKISAENLATALKANPFFIDLSSRLEVYPGKKDHEKVKSFMEAVKLEATAL